MFEDIIGNNKIKRELTNLVELNRCPHSMLFIGTAGIGKRLIAREFAKMILCEEEDKYCGKCKSCLEFDSNNNPDFGEIEPDGNNIKIDQIRELQKRIVESPVISQRKVYIINDADTATKEAQNALLKTLEEPPAFANIILIGSNESNFLSTIKSRCMILRFEDIAKEQIEGYLKKEFQMLEIPKVIISAASGSIGKAIKLKDKQDLYEATDKVINQLEMLDLIDVLKSAEIIYKSQEDKFEILDYMMTALFEKAKENIKYLDCLEIVQETKKRLKANSNYNMSIDNMMITIWEEIH